MLIFACKFHTRKFISHIVISHSVHSQSEVIIVRTVVHLLQPGVSLFVFIRLQNSRYFCIAANNNCLEYFITEIDWRQFQFPENKEYFSLLRLHCYFCRCIELHPSYIHLFFNLFSLVQFVWLIGMQRAKTFNSVYAGYQRNNRTVDDCTNGPRVVNDIAKSNGSVTVSVSL